MIVSGGENVFPGEVEDVITRHPDVVEVAVVGVADPEFGQRLKAFVVARPGTEARRRRRRDYVRDNLARYKVPRDVEFVDTLAAQRNRQGRTARARRGGLTTAAAGVQNGEDALAQRVGFLARERTLDVTEHDP